MREAKHSCFKAREKGFFCLYCVLKMITYEIDIIQNTYISLRNFTKLYFLAIQFNMDYSTLFKFSSKASDKSKSKIISSRGVIVKAVYICQEKPSPFHLEKLFFWILYGFYLKSFSKTSLKNGPSLQCYGKMVEP